MLPTRAVSEGAAGHELGVLALRVTGYARLAREGRFGRAICRGARRIVRGVAW